MAGIPSRIWLPFVLYFAFAVEPRLRILRRPAGLLACGKPEKAASALIQIGSGASALRSAQGWQQHCTGLERKTIISRTNLREMLSTIR